MLTVRAIPGAPLEANCYFVADITAGEAILVDAPWQIEPQITRLMADTQVRIPMIVMTHGHWDHSMGITELVAATGAAVAVHEADASLLEHPSYGPFSFPWPLVPVTPDRLLHEGDVIGIGAHHFSVLHAPGHTPGSICLYSADDRMLFSGDVLFAGSCGRIDLPGGDIGQMLESLRRLRELPAETRVLPGHGEDTTIAREARWLARAEEIIGW